MSGLNALEAFLRDSGEEPQGFGEVAAKPAPKPKAGYLKAKFKPTFPPTFEIERMAPSRDEFAAWRNDATTQFVMAALRHNAEECREHWLELSWGGGEADQRKLDALRERSDALLGFTADYEAFCVTLGLEPERETNAE